MVNLFTTVKKGDPGRRSGAPVKYLFSRGFVPIFDGLKNA